jgi:hypothetical protein
VIGRRGAREARRGVCLQPAKMINEAFDHGVIKAVVLNALRVGFETADASEQPWQPSTGWPMYPAIGNDTPAFFHA